MYNNTRGDISYFRDTDSFYVIIDFTNCSAKKKTKKNNYSHLQKQDTRSSKSTGKAIARVNKL